MRPSCPSPTRRCRQRPTPRRRRSVSERSVGVCDWTCSVANVPRVHRVSVCLSVCAMVMACVLARKSSDAWAGVSSQPSLICVYCLRLHV